jgi:hypothetical protein
MTQGNVKIHLGRRENIQRIVSSASPIELGLNRFGISLELPFVIREREDPTRLKCERPGSNKAL